MTALQLPYSIQDRIHSHIWLDVCHSNSDQRRCSHALEPPRCSRALCMRYVVPSFLTERLMFLYLYELCGSIYWVTCWLNFYLTMTLTQTHDSLCVYIVGWIYLCVKSSKCRLYMSNCVSLSCPAVFVDSRKIIQRVPLTGSKGRMSIEACPE